MDDGRPNFGKLQTRMHVADPATARKLSFSTPTVDFVFDLLAFDDQVGREDATLVEGVQRGVSSGALEHGVLMSRSEQLIGHFHALTAAALEL